MDNFSSTMPDLVDPTINAAVSQIIRRNKRFMQSEETPVFIFIKNNIFLICIIAFVILLLYFAYTNKSESIESTIEKLVTDKLNEKYNSNDTI
jgi:hypothetical protein